MKNGTTGQGYPPEDEREKPKSRVINFETIRKQKERERKGRKILAGVVIGVIVAAAAAVFISQMLLVSDGSRDFWSNFASMRHGGEAGAARSATVIMEITAVETYLAQPPRELVQDQSR